MKFMMMMMMWKDDREPPVPLLPILDAVVAPKVFGCLAHSGSLFTHTEMFDIIPLPWVDPGPVPGSAFGSQS